MRPALVTFLLLATLLSACSGAGGIEIPGLRPGAVIAHPEDRVAAPTDAFPLLDEDGELSLADLAGDVVVVNFWASWCGPCRAEQPELNDAHNELAADDVSFVGVNVLDPEANASAYRREFDVPYPSIFDRAGEFAAKFRGVSPQALPTTIVLDRDGRVAVRLFGVTSAPELRAVVGYLTEEA
ncbi:MAG: TlpA family protein disulfide reductase [Actinobacteria bacterium]|nr:TlpA family protein disulfide reductase [Actinomycetota bacterium]